MKKFLLLLSLSFLTGMVAGQSSYRYMVSESGGIYFFPRVKTFELTKPELDFIKGNQPASTLRIDMYMPEFNQELSALSSERPMDMQILSGAYRPYFNVYAPMLRRHPTAFDFHEAYAYPLSNRSAFIIQGVQATWPGAGSLNTVSAIGTYNVDKFTFWGEGFAGRYGTPYEISPGFMGGFTAGASYQATDWMRLNAFGQYTIYDKKGKDNMFVHLNPSYKQTMFGGSVDFKVSESFGFGVGVVRQHNPMSKSWHTIPLFYPTFHHKNSSISIGFQ